MQKSFKITISLFVVIFFVGSIYLFSIGVKKYSKLRRIHYLIAEYMRKEQPPLEKAKLLDEFKNIGEDAIAYMLMDLKRAASDLNKGSSTVWGSAIILAELQETKAIPLYSKLLNSKYPGLNLIAAVSLCRIGDKRGINGLLMIFEKSDKFGQRKTALYHLGNYGNLDTLVKLNTLLAEEKDDRIIKLIDKAIIKIKKRNDVIIDIDSPPHNL